MAKLRVATDAVKPEKTPAKKRSRAPRRRFLTQTFHLVGGVEVVIKFPEGAARWQSTQESVSISTGDAALPVAVGYAYAPQNGLPFSPAGVPSLPSTTNCDDRGLNFTRGTADPLETFKNGIPGFLDRVEDSVIANEIGADPNAEIIDVVEDEEPDINV